MSEYAFNTPEPVELFVENGSGTIEITAADVAESTVHVDGKRADEVTVTQDGHQLSVIAPKWRASGIFSGDQSLAMTILVPTRSRVVIKSGSADVDVRGTAGGARVKCGSGDVTFDRLVEVGVIDTGSGDIDVADAADELRVRSGSGDVHLGEVRATAAVSTGSGDVVIDHSTSSVVVKTGSGNLEITDAEGDVAMKTGSGDTVIRAARRGRITSKGASGNVRIGIPAGTPVWTDVTTVTGRLSSSIEGVGQPEPGSDHVELRASTVSGDVVLAAV